VQLWWIQSLNDLRFFSSAKKDGPEGGTDKVFGVVLVVVELWFVLVCCCLSWID